MFDEASESRPLDSLEDDMTAWARDMLGMVDEDNVFHSMDVDGDDFQAIKVQLFALGLIKKSVRKRGVRDANTYWTLTPYGEAHLMRLRAIHSAEKELPG